MTFAAIAARATAAAFRHLSDTTALLDGTAVTGFFGNGYSDQFGAIATAMPTFTLPSSAAASAAQGSELLVDIDGAAAAAGVALSVSGATTAYLVRAVEPDGTGMTVLRLELAA